MLSMACWLRLNVYRRIITVLSSPDAGAISAQATYQCTAAMQPKRTPWNAYISQTIYTKCAIPTRTRSKLVRPCRCFLNCDRSISELFKKKRHNFLRQSSTLGIEYQPSRLAGHSKWNNIRHIKAAKDDQKQKLSNAVVQRIKIAVIEGNGADPKLNSRLARVIQQAKEKDIPMATIENVLKKLTSARAGGKQLYLEVKGIGNCRLIIQCFTNNANRTRKDVNIVTKKYGGTIVDSGLASHAYDYKGVVYASQTDTPATGDAVELAIEAGAEDVQQGLDEDNQQVLKFVCGAKELRELRKSLEKQSVAVKSAAMEYIPHTFSCLTMEQAEQASKLLNKLLDLDDVVRVYDNIEVTDS